MDWKTLGHYALLIGLFVAMATLFNGVNSRIHALNDRMDRMQAGTNGRFDSINARFDALHEHFDAMQVENSRQHDDLKHRFDEALRPSCGRTALTAPRPHVR